MLNLALESLQECNKGSLIFLTVIAAQYMAICVGRNILRASGQRQKNGEVKLAEQRIFKCFIVSVPQQCNHSFADSLTTILMNSDICCNCITSSYNRIWFPIVQHHVHQHLGHLYWHVLPNNFWILLSHSGFAGLYIVLP